MTTKSEFGRGLCYNLGLFLAHERSIEGDKESYNRIGNEDRAYVRWFYGAADHIIELQIPENLSPYLKGRIRKFRDRVVGLRLPMDVDKNATKEDYFWAILEARNLLRLIDKFHGVKTMKGEYQ